MQFTLQAGDAVAFPGDAAHGYGNPGTTPARFSLAVFEPGVGHGSAQEHGDAVRRLPSAGPGPAERLR